MYWTLSSLKYSKHAIVRDVLEALLAKILPYFPESIHFHFLLHGCRSLNRFQNCQEGSMLRKLPHRGKTAFYYSSSRSCVMCAASNLSSQSN